MSNDHVFHLAAPTDLEQAHACGRYRCASLDTEGFIHCCDADQLAGVIERYYADTDDVVLLEVVIDALDAPLKRENTVGGTELFPHIYGEIPMAAVRHAQPFGRDSSARKALSTS